LDVFALLSTANEGVSQAILQAAFLQKPLISTPTGGLREVCLDQKTGLLVSPFCPKEVADAVTKMQKNPTARETWGHAARALVLEKFTFKQTIDGMEQVYWFCKGEKS
jgi:glycosyltransferase involved in cell wall biosynthesis